MTLFDTDAPGSTVEVPGFYVAEASGLRPLAAPAPKVPSPSDDNIQPGQGDDLTAPNATTAARMNRVVCVASANVGYSKAAKDTHMLPSALEYDAVVEECEGKGDFALTLRMVLEYESAFPEEGMVVWVKKHQQLINDEKVSELLLMETSFEDFVNGSWVPISTDVRYAEEAEAVVQAVITSDSGQTAGRVKTQGAVEDAKLGPVGERGRIVLTYRCERLYSYAEMGLGAAAGARSLVPLGLQLPWAAVDNPGSHCSLRAVVRGPAGASQLAPEANILAYRDLQRSFSGSSGEASAQCAVIPSCSCNPLVQEWEFSCSVLPPKPTMVLAWLSIPDIDDSWEQVEAALPKTTRAKIMLPKGQDAKLLRVAQPGGLEAQLVRCRVETEAPARSPESLRVHTDITISDASGSTGMTSQGQTVRSRLNKHEERRVLKRLEAIPKLRQAGVLLDKDVWCQLFVIFDHGVRSQFGIEVTVGDLDAATVQHLVKALVDSDSVAAAALEQAGKRSLLESWRQALTTLRGLTPGGTTSFVAGTNKAKDNYLQSVKSKYRNRELTAYVNFDTDGGNNCGPCYDAIKALVQEADVVQGHVLGVGSWVDQDCAAKVARLLKGSTSLALTFPENAGADDIFRQDLSRWIKALRTCPVTLHVSAGATGWAARHGQRLENGVECLFADGDGMSFDLPDVSDPNFTRAVLRGLQAGESTTLYLLSRLPIEQLASSLVVSVGGVPAQVSVGTEQLSGVALGHRWLSMLGAEGSVEGRATNKSTLCKRLRYRLEDDLSFAWNLPTKSGSTAAVGRAKTERRLPVSQAQQPEEPTAPELVEEVPRGGSVGLFGGGGPALFNSWGAPPPAAGLMFGACGGGAPGAASFGGGAMMGFPGGAPQMMACAGLQMSPQMAAFGSPAPPMAAFGSPARRSCAAPAPPGFGGMGKGAKGKSGPGGMSNPSNPEVPGPATPSQLLSSSGYMRHGAKETPQQAVWRGVKAVKHLAGTCVSPPPIAGVAAKPMETEDPLVADLLGGGSAGGTGTAGGPAGRSTLHHGFVCDATGANPLTGVRFKAASMFDCDVAEEPRRAGQFAGGAGFRPIKDGATAMRWALAAVLMWWRLVWKDREDLFKTAAPDLQGLDTAALSQAILNLPDVAQPESRGADW